MSETKTTASAPKKGSILNQYFHYADRGSTAGKEIGAGVTIFLLSACAIFLNMQLIAKLTISGSYTMANASQVAANGEIYAMTYFLSMMIAFAGSLLIGVVARLPLVQTASLGFSTVMISLMGTADGLTYSNLLLLCFAGSIAYALLISIPGLKEQAMDAIPSPVRKALPAAVGLMLAFVAMQLTGLVTVSGSDISIYGTGTVLSTASDEVSLFGLISFTNFSYATDKFHPMLLISALSVLLTFAGFVLYRRVSKHPYLYAFLTGSVFFLVVSICAVGINWKNFNFSLDSLWGRLYMIGGEDAMQYHISRILRTLDFGAIFSEGLDFSAYIENGGNVVLLFVKGMLVFVLMSLSDAQATLRATAKSSGAFDADNKKDIQLALMCNAGINIVAPIVGASPLAISKTSYAGTEDGAKSGLASVVAAILFLATAFVWIVPFFFSTVGSYTISFNMYGHYGVVMQLMSECSFGIADAVMVILGLSMVARSFTEMSQEKEERIPFLATIAGTFFLSNIAYGVAVGAAAYAILKLGSREEKKLLGVGGASLVFAVLGIAALVMAAII